MVDLAELQKLYEEIQVAKNEAERLSTRMMNYRGEEDRRATRREQGRIQGECLTLRLAFLYKGDYAGLDYPHSPALSSKRQGSTTLDSGPNGPIEGA